MEAHVDISENRLVGLVVTRRQSISDGCWTKLDGWQCRTTTTNKNKVRIGRAGPTLIPIWEIKEKEKVYFESLKSSPLGSHMYLELICDTTLIDERVKNK